MHVSFSDVVDEIVIPGGKVASAKLEEWRNDHRYAREVVPFVTSFSQDFMFVATRAEFDTVAAIIEADENQHALKGVSRADNIPLTKNLNSSFAFIHLFHRYVQQKRRIPTWLEWREWLRTEAASMFAIPVSRTIRFDRMDKAQKTAVKKGLTWRLGLAYYSCMRELDVMLRLRDLYGLNVRYHVLADALYRVDFWLGTKTVCLFVSNDEMKAAQTGRKPRPGQFLTSPPFSHYEAVLETQHTYGVLHPATDKAVEKIARFLRGAHP